jgi:hypothetical protein
MTERKAHQTRLALATVAGLAIGFAAAGCSSGAVDRKAPPERTRERLVIINLKMDRDGSVVGIGDVVSDDLKTKGKEAAVSKKEGDFLHWIVNPPYADVTLKIALADDAKAGKDRPKDPFETPIEEHGKHNRSGKISPKAPTTDQDHPPYEYKVFVFDNKRKTNIPLDPIIRVDP